MKAVVALSGLLAATSQCAAFVSPKRGLVGAGSAADSTAVAGMPAVQRRAAPASGTRLDAKKASYHFENYDKPIVLLGSSQNDELSRLAASLSGALTGNNAKVIGATLDVLKGGAGAALLGDGGDGISISVKSAADAAVVSGLVADGTLGLLSGVVVVDFAGSEGLDAVAKALYEDEGLMSVYVNIQPDGPTDASKKLEEEVLIPYSDYELCIKGEGSGDGWADIEWELQRIIGRALLASPALGAGPSDTPYNSAELMMGLNTFFLSLSFPHVSDAAPYVEKMCQDVDYMEYRVDLLDVAKEFSAGDKSKRFDVMYQQQQLRTMCKPHAQRAPALPLAGASIIDDAFPVVYTVRTAGQAGTWPDDEEGIGKMFDLLELGLRSGVECLDVESAWDPELTTKLMGEAQARYTSLILGSHHVVGEQVEPDEAVRLYRQCRIQDRAHGAKVVLSILSNDDKEDHLAYDASVDAVYPDEPEVPNVSLLLGDIGKYSRVLNPRFTPVTHESLPFVAAPGQMTASEIMKEKVEEGILPAKRFGILGHNIAYSVSPLMQGAAFDTTKLPHKYERHDLETVEEFVKGDFFNDPNFGGASVTIPHKQAIVPYIDVLSDAVNKIGSVNTIIAKKNKSGNRRVLIGDNTDWKGMYNPCRRKIGDDVKEGEYALVLGGGGTARAAAYTATQLGLPRIYWGRTLSKAQDFADTFGGTAVSSLDEEGEGSLGAFLEENGAKIKLVLSTIPKTAKFELPPWLLADPTSLPVVLDVNYKPYNTPLLLQCVEAGCDVVRGSEMLWEQGAGQFELWTGRMAPYGVMKSVVLKNCLEDA